MARGLTVINVPRDERFRELGEGIERGVSGFMAGYLRRKQQAAKDRITQAGADVMSQLLRTGTPPTPEEITGLQPSPELRQLNEELHKQTTSLATSGEIAPGPEVIQGIQSLQQAQQEQTKKFLTQEAPDQIQQKRLDDLSKSLSNPELQANPNFSTIVKLAQRAVPALAPPETGTRPLVNVHFRKDNGKTVRYMTTKASPAAMEGEMRDRFGIGPDEDISDRYQVTNIGTVPVATQNALADAWSLGVKGVMLPGNALGVDEPEHMPFKTESEALKAGIARGHKANIEFILKDGVSVEEDGTANPTTELSIPAQIIEREKLIKQLEEEGSSPALAIARRLQTDVNNLRVSLTGLMKSEVGLGLLLSNGKIADLDDKEKVADFLEVARASVNSKAANLPLKLVEIKQINTAFPGLGAQPGDSTLGIIGRVKLHNEKNPTKPLNFSSLAEPALNPTQVAEAKTLSGAQKTLNRIAGDWEEHGSFMLYPIGHLQAWMVSNLGRTGLRKATSENADVMADVLLLRNMILFSKGGKAITDDERKLVEQQLPNIGQSDVAFAGGLRVAQRYIKMMSPGGRIYAEAVKQGLLKPGESAFALLEGDTDPSVQAQTATLYSDPEKLNGEALLAIPPETKEAFLSGPNGEAWAQKYLKALSAAKKKQKEQ